MRPIRLLILGALFAGVAEAATLERADAPCADTAEPARWSSAGVPDLGRRPPLVSAHRGGINLAPENTLWAYRHAFAYGMDFVEIDVRESLDGVFYSMHDDEVARTTGGSGNISTMLSVQIDALNAANFEPWIGSEYDPSPVPRLEDILALARDSQRGIEFDIKFVKNYPGLFLLADQYGVLERSFFNMSGDTVTLTQLLFPDVRVIYNLAGDETAQALYDETGRSIIYGSAMDKFTPENIAAIHDGCSYVLPHSYDEGEANEAAEFQRGLAMGTDGAQINQPDLIRAVLAAPLAVKLEPSTVAEVGANAVCLSNAENGLGLPYKTLSVSRRDRSAQPSAVTNRWGCINLAEAADQYVVRFAGDASALAAQYNSYSTPDTPGDPLGDDGHHGGSLPAVPLLWFLLAAALRRRSPP